MPAGLPVSAVLLCCCSSCLLCWSEAMKGAGVIKGVFAGGNQHVRDAWTQGQYDLLLVLAGSIQTRKQRDSGFQLL